MISNLISVLADRYPGWQPQVIAELGANDGTDTIELYNQFKESTVIACEPDPQLAAICKLKFADKPRIMFLDKACSPIEGLAKFHQSTTGNHGIGSLYKPSGKYSLEALNTREIIVETIRLDTICAQHHINKIDLLWLDAQGGELGILQSMGELIKEVSIIYTEYEYQDIYTGQPLLADLHSFLYDNGFYKIWQKDEAEGWFGNAVYVNSRIIE